MQDVQYIASISYGKDSMAMLHIIAEHGLPLDRIITADVWFDENTRADYPEMAEFKDSMDIWIQQHYGITVEHFRADTTYTDIFYKTRHYGKSDIDAINGFPMIKGAWCNSRLKMAAINKANKQLKNCFHYIGIAADEHKRIERHKNKPDKIMPLVQFGITEQMAFDICKKQGTLAPTYQTGFRDGCWFCHNQQVSGLRRLRAGYPDLWKKLMRLDADSPAHFKPDGHTVHDFDKRFALEDCGMISERDRFKWEMINPNYEFQLKLLFEDEEDE